MGRLQCTVLILRTILLAVLVSAATAKYGAPIVHCRGDSTPVNFSWTIPPTALGKEIFVTHPRGEKLFSKIGNTLPHPDDTLTANVTVFEMDDSKIKFTWRNVSTTDVGDFLCREGSPTGPIVPECGQALHHIDIDQPHVRESGFAIQDQDFYLRCEVSVPSEAADLGLNFTIVWLRDGFPVQGQHGRLLEFKPLNLSDEGRYTCRVNEERRGCGSSNDSNPYSLHVMAPPIVSLRRHHHSPHVEFPEGASATLTCEIIRAYPPVDPNNITWTFSPSNSSTARQLPDTGYTLTLDRMTRGDSGLYTCKAWNADLLQGAVRLPPGHDSITVLVSYMENFNLTPDVEVREGEDFTLTCSVDSSPTALLQWFVNGVLRRYVTANLDRYLVPNATRHDRGNYTCRASSPLSRNERSSQVAVLSDDTSMDQNADSGMGARDVNKMPWTASNGGSPSAMDGLLVIVIISLAYYYWLKGLFGD